MVHSKCMYIKRKKTLYMNEMSKTITKFLYLMSISTVMHTSSIKYMYSARVIDCTYCSLRKGIDFLFNSSLDAFPAYKQIIYYLFTCVLQLIVIFSENVNAQNKCSPPLSVPDLI